MATNNTFTQLPTTTAAKLTDIISAVQNYQSTAVPGTSVQETLQQVYNLFQQNLILNFAGNPNGNLSGVLNQFSWDTINNILYICTTAGNISAAVWKKVIQLTAGTGISLSQSGNSITISAIPQVFSWNVTTTTLVTLAVNNGYIANNAALVTYNLPATSAVGDVINIMGGAGSTGGWKIACGAGQSINLGTVTSTVSASSTRNTDGIQLICLAANTVWQNLNAPQGNISLA